jgi:hypothetical protein
VSAPPRVGGAPLSTILEALRRAIARDDDRDDGDGEQEKQPRSTLRTLGEEIGLSFSGVRKLIAGSEPRPGTVVKLKNWFVREGWRHLGTEVDADTARAAFEILLDGIPPGRERDALVARWLKEVAALREQAGAPPAEWIQPIAEELKGQEAKE